MSKRCSVCCMDKTLDCFGRSGNQCKACVKHWHAVHYQKVKDKHLEQGRRFRRNNPGKDREYSLKSALKTKYDMTLDQYYDMVKAQENKCAICKSTDPKRKNSLRFFVDHDHKTNKVRGLLCHRCNLAVGWMEDQVTIVEAVKEYLTREV